VPLLPGDPAPWFVCRTSSNPRYHFDSVAGRYIVLSFFGTAGNAPGAAALSGFAAQRGRFNDEDAAFFGVSADPEDERQARVADRVPGLRFFWDPEGAVAKVYGLAPGERRTFVIDESLKVVASVELGADAAAHVRSVMAVLDALPPLASLERMAPVLVCEGVFEADFRRQLIGYYDARGGQDSGFMREENGRTVGRIDHDFKRRYDCNIDDEVLRQACAERIGRRLAPQVRRAYQFNPTRMERYIISCYEGQERGRFRAHRDNTTKGTAHRRFAVSLFLNDDYRGGELIFPEYGRRRYKASAGGAVVFSCSLLHEALPVTEGKRFMFLPFLYDEAAAKIREQNSQFLEPDKQGYKA
jgi:peroxiredoxin/predicted 2-oxoglutarate/Fe(II)-dependent dioxygenase YbiX